MALLPRLLDPLRASTAVLVLLVPAADGAVPLRINCGGEAHVDAQGRAWVRDAYHNGVGHPEVGQLPPEFRTADPPIYRTRRWVEFSSPVHLVYSVRVDRGTYDVSLHFAEIHPAVRQSYTRVFHVWIENDIYLWMADVFAQVGRQGPWVVNFTVHVDDGSLDIEFVPYLYNPMVSGIEILPSGLTSAGPAGFRAVLVSPHQVDLSWSNREPQLSGVPYQGIRIYRDGNILTTYKPEEAGKESYMDSSPSAGFHLYGVEADHRDGRCSRVLWPVLSGPPFRIDAGSPRDHKDHRQQMWSRDLYFTTGYPVPFDVVPVAGAEDPVLYHSYRFGLPGGERLAYKIPVPAGSYVVRLHFAEFFFGESGLRRFDVLLEGTTYLDDYDPLERAGGPGGLAIEAIPVCITDGVADIEFRHEFDNPFISAIEIVEGIPVCCPSGFTCAAVEDGVRCEWEGDPAGYTILQLTRDYKLVGILQPDETEFLDEGVLPGLHTYRLTARRSSGPCATASCVVPVQVDNLLWVPEGGREDAAGPVAAVLKDMGMHVAVVRHVDLFDVSEFGAVWWLAGNGGGPLLEPEQRDLDLLLGYLENQGGRLYVEGRDRFRRDEMSELNQVLAAEARGVIPGPVSWITSASTTGCSMPPMRLGHDSVAVDLDVVRAMAQDALDAPVELLLDEESKLPMAVYNRNSERQCRTIASSFRLADVAGEESRRALIRPYVECLFGLQAPLFRRGDVDGDGSMGIRDAIMTLTFIFTSGWSLDCPDAADADDNGSLQLADALILLRYIFGAGQQMRPSRPYLCGVDPTPDRLPPCLGPPCK